MEDQNEQASGINAAVNAALESNAPPEPEGETLEGLCEELAVTYSERKELEGQIAALKKAEKDLEAKILPIFEESGTSLVGSKSRGITIYLKREIFAGKVEHDPDGLAMFEGLRASGYEDLIKETVNTRTLAKVVKEDFDRDDDDLPVLPPELADVINISEKYSVACRKS